MGTSFTMVTATVFKEDAACVAKTVAAVVKSSVAGLGLAVYTLLNKLHHIWLFSQKKHKNKK